MSVLVTSIQKAPRKRSPFHQYFKSYWKSCIKNEYLSRYAIARKEYDDATDDEKTSGIVKKPIPVQIRTETGMELWLLESDECCAKITEEAENVHAKEMEEWTEAKETPVTAVQFHR
jgi:hypothetical protein